LPLSRWPWLLAAQKTPKKLQPQKQPLKSRLKLAWKPLKLLAMPLPKQPKLLAKQPKLLLKAPWTLPKALLMKLLLPLAKPRTLLLPLATLPRRLLNKPCIASQEAC
jgi:hypothetical protein